MTRLVIAAFDGLLPQQVNPDLTPNIHALATRGVRFERHHSVYPTVTRVNSAAMVTGCYPGKHGIPANTAVFSDHDPHSVMQVLQPGLDSMAANPDTPVLFVPTIGEILASAGMTHVSIVGGSSGNAYVHFPRASEAGRGGLIHPEFSLPSELGKADEEMLGPWPESSVPGLERIGRVAETATKFVIPEIDPDLLFVWFPEPDGANHAHGLDSGPSKTGLGEADAAFGRILATVSDRGDQPDVIVISDHGYSTISDVVDVAADLQSGGFEVNNGDGSVLVGGNGGSVLLNYPGAEDSEVQRLTEWLADRPWAGPMFSPLDSVQDLGAIPSDEVFIAGTRAPHIAVSMAWEDRPAKNGFRGTAWNGGGRVGAGLHGSASPYELRNTLIAGGPSFKQNFASTAPSGNIDLTPTALRILGQDVPAHMDGRVLEEALKDGPELADIEVYETTLEGAPLRTTDEQTHKTRHYARLVTASGHSYLESAGVR